MSAPTTHRPLAGMTGATIGHERVGRLAAAVRRTVRAAAARILPDRSTSELRPWMMEPGFDDFPG